MADAAEADPDEARKQELKIRKDAAEMEVLIRFYEVFSKTMEGLRKALGDIAGRIDAIDATVFHGMGVVEETVLTQGMNEGATKFGIYGILDLLFNTNSQEYFGINKEGRILRFDWAGNEVPSPKPPSKPFQRFIYCAPTRHYICYTPTKTSFFLAKEDFTVLIESVAVAPISSIIFCGRKAEDSFDFFVISGATLNRYHYHFGSNLIALHDAITLSDMEADRKVIELTCFDDPKDDRKQWIYCIYDNNCTIVDVTGRVHGTKRSLHPRGRKITAITAIGASDFVLTGDSKGLLKLWALRWQYIGEIQAHSGRITQVIEHPEGRASISFGKDQKLFVWSFDTQKEIESLPISEVVDRVAINPYRKGFMAQGARQIVMWRMNSIVWRRQNTAAPVQKFLLSADNGLTRQMVAMCSDNAIYVLNPACGQAITTALAYPAEPPMRDVAYRRLETGDTLYALVENESIYELQLFDCKTNPAHLIQTWDETKWDVGITACALYEHNSRLAVSEKQMTFSRRKNVKPKPKTFLLCGRRDGAVVTVNLETGNMDYVIAGHQGSVTHIEIDHELNEAISLGTSPSIRLWKIAYAEDDILVPLMDITWKHHPIAVATILRSMIAFGLDHPETDQHRVVIFDTLTAQKFDHSPENGHTMNILSISGSRELILFCTSSLDGTVMIRGPQNEVYRVVVLNGVPSCAAFGNPQGDIFIGIGQGIFVLPGEKHLTFVPRNRVIMSEFSAGELEGPIPCTRTTRDTRFVTEREGPREMVPFPVVGPAIQEPDSQQSRNFEKVRTRNMDIQRIIEGRHPLEDLVPDFHNMSKQQWDEFGKSVYDEDDGEDRKFFASESRMAAMLKLKMAAKDLEDFDNIS